MAIEHWGFFSVPHLLWHGASVYNGHLRGPVILTPIAERFKVELSLCFNDVRLSQSGFEHPTSCARHRLRHQRGTNNVIDVNLIFPVSFRYHKKSFFRKNKLVNLKSRRLVPPGKYRISRKKMGDLIETGTHRSTNIKVKIEILEKKSEMYVVIAGIQRFYICFSLLLS